MQILSVLNGLSLLLIAHKAQSTPTSSLLETTTSMLKRELNKDVELNASLTILLTDRKCMSLAIFYFSWLCLHVWWKNNFLVEPLKTTFPYWKYHNHSISTPVFNLLLYQWQDSLPLPSLPLLDGDVLVMVALPAPSFWRSQYHTLTMLTVAQHTVPVELLTRWSVLVFLEKVARTLVKETPVALSCATLEIPTSCAV